jgi:bacterioferritin-associated ferredoxin
VRGVWICLCVAVNSGRILEVIDAGATTVREVSSATGAATDCGKCARSIHLLLEQQRVAGPATRPGGPE